MSETMKLKTTCITPKGKAKKCIVEWRKQFPTFKKPIKEKLVSDSEFYWIYEFDKEKDLLHFHKKVLMAEEGIKKMYNFMFKFFTRANKMLNKSVWTTKKIKNWLVNQYKKKVQGNEEQIDKIKKMNDEEFKKYIKIEDEEEMREFLTKQLIKCEVFNNETKN